MRRVYRAPAPNTRTYTQNAFLGPTANKFTARSVQQQGMGPFLVMFWCSGAYPWRHGAVFAIPGYQTGAADIPLVPRAN